MEDKTKFCVECRRMVTDEKGRVLVPYKRIVENNEFKQICKRCQSTRFGNDEFRGKIKEILFDGRISLSTSEIAEKLHSGYTITKERLEEMLEKGLIERKYGEYRKQKVRTKDGFKIKDTPSKIKWKL